MQIAEKEEKLKKMLNQYTKEDTMVAFSGGVDSSLLLKILCDLAKKNETKVYAVTVQTKLHPKSDLAVAKRVANEAGAIHQIVEIDELNETGIENNPKDRCYRCKKGIFTKIKDLAKTLGIRYVMEGTNEDDLYQYRPGIKALKELEILSPLAEYSLSKKEIRLLAKKLGISVANRPSMPCLATRLPYGDKINYELLERIEKGENYIRGLGYYNVRLRVHGELVRIEVDKDECLKLVEQSEEIIQAIKGLGFTYVTLDLEGFRSGSMDAILFRR